MSRRDMANMSDFARVRYSTRLVDDRIARTVDVRFAPKADIPEGVAFRSALRSKKGHFSHFGYVKAHRKKMHRNRVPAGRFRLWAGSPTTRNFLMTNQNDNNDKQKNLAAKDQNQPKTGQQTGQQQGQHVQQGKGGEATPNADAKPNQDNKTNINKDESQKNKS